MQNLLFLLCAVIARGLGSPLGVTYRRGNRNVAEINRVTRFPNIMPNLAAPPERLPS